MNANNALPLLCGNVTLAVVNGERSQTFCERGVKTLLTILSAPTASDTSTPPATASAPSTCAAQNSPPLLFNADVADKVVGKAAALMFVLGGVKRVYASVISQSALNVLNTHGVETVYEKLVPYIINRAGNGPCPMEYAVRDTEDPQTAYKILLKATQSAK